VSDHPVQRTQVKTSGCKILFGVSSRPVGTINQKSDASSLLFTTYFRHLVIRGPRVSTQAI